LGKLADGVGNGGQEGGVHLAQSDPDRRRIDHLQFGDVGQLVSPWRNLPEAFDGRTDILRGHLAPVVELDPPA
jgi:hypothetical protein